MPGFSLIWDELYETNPERFFVAFRMSPQVFDILLSEIEAAIYHQVMIINRMVHKEMLEQTRKCTCETRA